MKRTRHLNDLVVADCVPADTEYAVHDTAVRGFALRIQPSGSKTWTLRFLQDGRPRRVSLGDARVMPAEQARARAHALLARGETARTAPMQAGPRFAEYEAVYKERRQLHWKPTTIRTYESYMRSTLMPTFGGMSLAAITRIEVASWFHTHGVMRPGGANRALAILKDMFNRAKEWALVPASHVNPCRGLVPNRRPPRGRLLNQEALAQLGIALTKLSKQLPDVVNIVELLLFTGCRPGEIMRLRWDEVRANRLTLTDAKTGPRVVLIGAPAVQLLAHRERVGASPYVFPDPNRPARPRYNIGRAWNRIRREAGLPDDIRLHDLRHTYASHAVMGGETMLMTGSLLGHRRSQTTARYAHLQDAFLLAAAERIAGRITQWWSATT